MAIAKRKKSEWRVPCFGGSPWWRKSMIQRALTPISSLRPLKQQVVRTFSKLISRALVDSEEIS